MCANIFPICCHFFNFLIQGFQYFIQGSCHKAPEENAHYPVEGDEIHGGEKRERMVLGKDTGGLE